MNRPTSRAVPARADRVHRETDGADSPGISITAVGDLMVGDTAASASFGFASRYGRDGMASVAGRIHRLVGGADIVFGNLECMLSLRGLEPGRWRSVQMRGRPSFAGDLRNAGFTVLAVANNHAVQHGVEAFHETVELLENAGIRACGVRGQDGWASQPVILPVRDRRVGVLGYSLRPRQYSTALPPYAEGTEAGIRADVSRLRPTVDHVIVSLHWGEEYVSTPATEEVALGRAIIDAGASLIIGHHPHVARPVELYRGGVIAYSLGNFVADMVWQPGLRKAALLRCTLMREGTDAETVPLWVGDDFIPAPADDGDWGQVVNVIEGLPPADYRKEVEETVRSQQLASYRYAAENLFRYDRTLLRQLVVNTLRNKLSALVR